MKNLLEQLRSRAGLTQQDLADRVEVSRQTIISLESGRYNPSILLAFRLSRLFNLSIESIFIYEEDLENEKE
jgi:putative transcriptional regulator